MKTKKSRNKIKGGTNRSVRQEDLAHYVMSNYRINYRKLSNEYNTQISNFTRRPDNHSYKNFMIAYMNLNIFIIHIINKKLYIDENKFLDKLARMKSDKNLIENSFEPFVSENAEKYQKKTEHYFNNNPPTNNSIGIKLGKGTTKTAWLSKLDIGNFSKDEYVVINQTDNQINSYDNELYDLYMFDTSKEYPILSDFREEEYIFTKYIEKITPHLCIHLSDVLFKNKRKLVYLSEKAEKFDISNFEDIENYFDSAYNLCQECRTHNLYCMDLKYDNFGKVNRNGTKIVTLDIDPSRYLYVPNSKETLKLREYFMNIQHILILSMVLYFRVKKMFKKKIINNFLKKTGLTQKIIIDTCVIIFNHNDETIIKNYHKKWLKDNGYVYHSNLIDVAFVPPSSYVSSYISNLILFTELLFPPEMISPSNLLTQSHLTPRGDTPERSSTPERNLLPVLNIFSPRFTDSFPRGNAPERGTERDTERDTKLSSAPKRSVSHLKSTIRLNSSTLKSLRGNNLLKHLGITPRRKPRILHKN